MDEREQKSDQSLCFLNQKYLDIINSKEYRTGVNQKKLMQAIKHFDIDAIFSGWKGLRITAKLKKLNKANDGFLSSGYQCDDSGKIVVYTCITGEYDEPIEPLYVPENVDFRIVTDMDIPADSRWGKIDINQCGEIEHLDNVRKARYVKTHPHLFFPGYMYSIWVDANFRIVGDLTKFIQCLGKVVPFASNWHPKRNSIYSECTACILLKKDNPEILKKQTDHYREEGMPDDFGLIETNMIVRKHNDPSCIDLMESWWEEIKKWSTRDQLSLPFVIWSSGYTMKDLGFICKEIRENPSVQVVLHASKKK